MKVHNLYIAAGLCALGLPSIADARVYFERPEPPVLAQRAAPVPEAEAEIERISQPYLPSVGAVGFRYASAPVQADRHNLYYPRDPETDGGGSGAAVDAQSQGAALGGASPGENMGENMASNGAPSSSEAQDGAEAGEFSERAPRSSREREAVVPPSPRTYPHDVIRYFEERNVDASRLRESEGFMLEVPFRVGRPAEPNRSEAEFQRRKDN